jgi:hypothetical protein
MYPEIAAEADGWDPCTVTVKSGRKKQWRCILGHTWLASVSERTPPVSSGCPVCSGRQVLTGFNDLATLYPKVAAQADCWNPSTVTPGSQHKATWRCEIGHTWTATVTSRIPPASTGCPVCAGKRVHAGFNDLASRHPDIAAEADGWDPATVTSKSHSKRRWRCEHGHKWEAVVSTRTPPVNAGCPFCSGNQVLAGFNDLATVHPDIAAQADGWDPQTVSHGSGRKLGWRCSEGHFWTAIVVNRTPPQSLGCPVCSGKQVLAGFNDLATLFPEIASEAEGWDSRSITSGSSKIYPWRCRLGHIYRASVKHRTRQNGSGCPFCDGKKVFPGFNDLASLFPEVASQADGWDPSLVTGKSSKTMPWRCSKGHAWKSTVTNRTGNGSGCPDCAEAGYKPSLPAWFYMLERPGEQQLGITNYKEDRLRFHSIYGWQELEVVGPFPGDEVLALEKKLKKWLRTEVGLVPGTHENWFTASLEVQSLAELKARSGVETDFF